MEIDYCTKSPDKIWEVPIGVPCCKAHDKGYEKSVLARSAILAVVEKSYSDILLMLCIIKQGVLGVWRGITYFTSGVLAICYAPIVLIVVSTVGWYFWFKEQKRVRDR